MKTYRVVQGVVVLPLGIARTPSGDNARFLVGETFDVDVDSPEVQPHLRYLRKRVAAGDLLEVEETPPVPGSTPPLVPPATETEPTPAETSLPPTEGRRS